jgi:hypothetical protein
MSTSDGSEQHRTSATLQTLEFAIPCESALCARINETGGSLAPGMHASDWIVRFACCGDTEAWCNVEFVRTGYQGLYVTDSHTCASCGSATHVVAWIPTHMLGESPAPW